MAIQEQFEKFYENIKLTSFQREDAKRKYDGVCSKLHSHYYPNTTYDGNTRFLIGSYGKKTHIRPARDIDIIFIMPPKKFSQYDDNNSDSQSQLLQNIKRVLEEKYPNTPIKAFGKVVVLEFSDPQHNVELCPAWENENGTFIIPNSENGGSWEVVDHRAEIKRIKDSNEQTGKTRALIRMVKKWAELCTAPVKSYVIENKVLEFFSFSNSDSGYSTTIRDFFNYFYSSASDEKLKSHISTALNRATKGCDFESEQKIDKATEEWQKIFGEAFPSAETEKGVVATFHQIISKLQSLFPALTEEHLNRKYGIETVLNPDYSVTVDVNVNQNGWRKNHWLLSEFQKRGYRIQKSASLLFKIISHNVPEPYSVKWKVRNFGNEAQELGALRGEITDDDGSETKKESTLYHGEHYVECYIIRNGQCVAIGHVFVPIG
ncbi:MAG: hypothetical protein COV70_01995 [Parcubacteria group bacterium CG11_big_fil_rev_8_21_14_0_20_39_22]|nr:MAG: hypothetical protein COV70_01995 [Parcubacteria group bacterium CG11_big_fil_rev_8_21_14_0_20_39_22]